MKKLILSTTMVMILFSTAAFADEYGKNKAFGKHHVGYDKMYRQLNLSDAQKKKIKMIFKNTRMKKGKAPHISNHQTLMDKRMTLIQAKTFDRVAVEQLADEQFADMKSRFVMMTEAEHKAWQVLTPEQQQQAQKLMQKRQKRMQKRMDKRQERQTKRYDKADN